MRSSQRRAARAAWLASGCAAVAAVHAQEGQREATTELDEVVVTAQKREESLQSVPIAVTALDARAIEKSFARDIQDVESLTPNLIIDPILGNGTAALSIRGMQLNDVEKSFDPAVAVYLDGVYLANTTGALLQMYDAEAVEVLRGPQGTLFGRNTIGGLLHIRRAKPSGELGGKLALSVGRFEQVDARAVLNLPAVLDERLATKLSVVSQTGGGYFDNVSRNTDEGEADFLGVSLSSLLKASDALQLWLTLDWFDDSTPTRPVTALTRAGELFCPPGCGAVKADADFHRRPTTTLDQEASVETLAATLHATWQLNDAHRLVSITGWRDLEDDAIQEFDGVAAQVFWTSRPQTSDQLSEELRWEADWNDRVRSTLGVYYFDSNYELNQVTFSPVFFPPASGIQNAPRNYEQDTESYAAFGQLDWDLTEAFTLSLGGRYTREEKTACDTEFITLTGVGRVPLSSFGACTGRPAYVRTYVDPVTGATVVQDGNETWSKFTPRVNLTYRLSDSKMVFATYSEGFRSGGFNGRASSAVSMGPYDPELVETIELGAKTQWLDNRLRLNLAAFTTDYQDKQEDVVFPDPFAVTVTLVQNAAAAEINGAELELLAVPATGLTVGLNVGLLDASYDEWLVPGLTGGLVDKSDFELRRAPELTAGVNLQYEQQLGAGRFLVYGLNYAYKDDYWITANTVTANPDRPGLVEAFGLLDASVSFEAESWRVSLWGKNLSDEDYFLHVLDVGTNYAAGPNRTPVPIPGLWTFGTINAPRTYGLEFEYRF